MCFVTRHVKLGELVLAISLVGIYYVLSKIPLSATISKSSST
jgi:hypothetical protein